MTKRQELGPRQIEWLRANVPHFKLANDDAEKVRAEEAKNREKFSDE